MADTTTTNIDESDYCYLYSSQVQGESLVSSWLGEDRSLVFYGDETWVKLFPGAWSRQEATHSFYVRDYTEVGRGRGRAGYLVRWTPT